MPTQTINGHQHYFEDAGNGPPLIMVHGNITVTTEEMARHIPDLSRDFRVIIPQLRGMGKSAHTKDLKPSSWADDVVGLMDALELSTAHVFGEANGSRTALRFAVDHPERVRSLTINAPILYAEPSSNEFTEKRFRPDSTSPEQAEEFRKLHGEDWADVVNAYLDMRNSPEAQEYFDMRELAAKITAPTFIMRGDQREDRIHSIEYAFLAYRIIPNAQLLIYPNAHNNIEEYDQEFRGFLKRFLLAH
jgi:pimeloyl-ACP methyl ester carboxylesterase